MERQVTERRRSLTFNGPLEAGLRAVCVLAAVFPRALDLHRLVAMDYLLVHTGDIGGPDSLHPETPLQSAALLVRRPLIERALLLMMTRNLVSRQVSKRGILYVAGETAAPFLSGLQTKYIQALQGRAEWLAGRVGGLNDSDFREVMHRYVDQWVEEFQGLEKSLGQEQ